MFTTATQPSYFKLYQAIAAIIVTLVASATNAKGNPVQWEAAVGGNGNYFEVIVTGGPISWDQARLAATQQIFNGWIGKLATAPTENKDLFIRELAAATPGAFVENWLGGQSGPWIGGFQPPGSPEPDGGWTWISGETWSYTNWYPGEPNQGGSTGSNEDCIQLVTDFFPINHLDVAWNDLSSGPNPVFDVHAYVVEYVVPEPSSAVFLGLAGLMVAHRRRRSALRF